MSEFVEVSTAELTGAALDLAMADAVMTHYQYGSGEIYLPNSSGEFTRLFQPSTDWAQCGPLIEKHQVNLIARPSPEDWCGAYIENGGVRILQDGETLLIAACRTIVASVYGETVSVPRELAAQ